MTTIVRKLWPLGWVREIARETGPYPTRWSLRRQYGDGDSHKNGGWRVYLHRFFSGDSELHNHPWRWSFSIVLWGSYEEDFFDAPTIRYWDGTSDGELDHSAMNRTGYSMPILKRRVRWFNWITSARFHQITKLHPRFGIGPITLFISGPPHGKSWGFWVPGRGVVPHLRRKRERDLLGSS